MNELYNIDLIEKSFISIGANSFMEHPAHFSAKRVIPDFDILLTISGQHRLNINGNLFLSSPNDIYILPPDSIFEIECKQPTKQFYCHFTLTGSNQCKLAGDFSHYRLPDSCTGLVETYKQHIEFSRSNNTPLISSVSLIIKLMLIEMLLHYPDNKIYIKAGDNDEIPSEIVQVVKYIHNMLDKHITVGMIAKSAGFNTSYFSRFFKKYTGMSPMKYIDSYKMKYAQYFIISTNKSMKEIAFLLGYTDQFIFSRKFKSYFGVTPTSFRENKL